MLPSCRARDLALGQNTSLVGPVLDVSLRTGRGAPADVSVLLLGADGRVAADTDFVFCNQPRSSDGAVVLCGGDNPDGASVDVTRLPDRYSRLVLVASASHQTSSVVGTALHVLDPCAEPSQLAFQPTDNTSMPALLCAEVYRRDGAWRLRAVGQGYRDGLDGLARDFGVDVDWSRWSTAGRQAAVTTLAAALTQACSRLLHACVSCRSACATTASAIGVLDRG